MGGNNDTVPTTINRVIVLSLGGATQDVILFGGVDKLVGNPSMASFPALLAAYPSLASLPVCGSMSSPNVEAILNLHPDIVITISGSQKTTPYQQIMAAGIPVVEVGAGHNNNLTQIETEMTMMGKLFNCPQKATDLLNFWNKYLAEIQSREQNIPAANKMHDYYELGSLTHTNGNGSWGQVLMDSAGVINVASGLGTLKDETLEQLLLWNPDMIFTSSNEGTFQSVASVMNNKDMQNVNAVKNSQVYLAPVAYYYWDRPSPECILGFLWLAKTNYPAQFADLDMYSVTNTFYQEFWNVTITPQQYTAFLNPTG
jgi:ABC-type Fe3+-hydroxamate transport system, periplasmic component